MIKTDCCPLIEMTLRRHRDAKLGLHVRRAFSLTGSSREFVTMDFRKAKRGDSDHGGEFSNATYAICEFCPFCGTKLERSK